MTEKILRFSASWCQPCKMLAKNLENTDLGVPIEVVDIDAAPELAEQYGIRSVPTLVYLKDGKEVGRQMGVKTPLVLEEWVRSYK